MAKKFLTPIDLSNNEIQNVKAQNLASDPGSPAAGQFWYNTTSTALKAFINGASRLLTWIGSTTPTGLSASSTNSSGSNAEAARVDHTHAITASASPSASSLVLYDANSKLSSTTPTGADAATIVATKGYVDALAVGLDVHGSVRVATVRALTNDSTTPAYNNTGGTSARGQITFATGPTTIDGVTLVNNDRILVKDDSAGLGGGCHGIWVRTSANTWDRATDWDADADVTSGAFMFVEEGTTNADSGWVLATNGTIVVGGASGTALTFSQFSSAGAVTATMPLLKTGSVLTWEFDNVTLDNSGAGTKAAIKNNGVGNSQLRQGGALTVIGNATNATANVADISAGSDGQVLRRSGTTLAFGAVSLSTAAAVTGTLPSGNGGTGFATWTTGQLLYASGTNTTAQLTVGSTGDLLTVSGGVPVWQSALTAGVTKKYAVDVGNGALTSITVTHNLGTKDVVVNVYTVASTFDEVECDVQITSTTAITLLFATAPTTAQYRCVVIG